LATVAKFAVVASVQLCWKFLVTSCPQTVYDLSQHKPVKAYGRFLRLWEMVRV